MFSFLCAREDKAVTPYDLYSRKTGWFETMLSLQKAMAENRDRLARRTPLPRFDRTDFTITAWVKTEDGGTIFAKAPAEGNWARGGKTFFIRGGRLCFDMYGIGCVTSRSPVADGEWHHVAVTKKGDRQQLFIDGKKDVEGSLRNDADGDAFVVKIGFSNRNFPAPSFFNGLLDEVCFFTRVLSPGELKKTAAGEALSLRGLAGCWQFEHGGTDASGYGNHGIRETGVQYTKGRLGTSLKLDGDTGCMVVDEGKRAKQGIPWPLFAGDFDDPESRRQMQDEQDDGIWEKKWAWGGWRELGLRYAGAVGDENRYKEQIGDAAQEVQNLEAFGKVRTLYMAAKAYGRFQRVVAELNSEGLRNAIRALEETDPSLKRYRQELHGIEDRFARMALPIDSREVEALTSAFRRLRHAVLVTHNPLIGTDKLLFVKRYTYQSSHYYTDYIDGCCFYGGNLCILSLSDGTVQELVPCLEGGIFGRFDLSYDAKRIVFDYKAQDREGFRLYEVGVDGAGLRQLTFPPPDEKERIEKYAQPHRTPGPGPYYHQTDDMHPCYLPDGGICFVSTRCERGILCDGPDILTTTALYRIDSDGSDMRLLSQTPVSEEVPTVTDDGRILYTRWEYVDKGGSAVKCLWAMRPDGSCSIEIYGNDHAFPSFYNGREVPGMPYLFTSIGGPHMPLGVGTVLLIDTNQPITERTPMTYITPEIDIRDEWGYRNLENGRWISTRKGPLFDDPFPLSDDFFLVSYNPDKDVEDKSAYGLYLLDAFGNRELIYNDKEMSCFLPFPLKPRKKPGVIPSHVDPDGDRDDRATVVMTDVYSGLDNVKRGDVAYIRVMEDIARPWSSRRFWGGDTHGQQHAVISKWTHTHAKVVHGVVPVEKDGSAHFTVPADANIFFQALDKDFMEIQRMRTFVNFRPGEKRSCIGCHEPLNLAPDVRYPIAMGKEPIDPKPQPGDDGPRPVYYSQDVQPMLDRHCVRCHDGKNEETDLVLTGEPTTLFNRSYEEIVDGNLVRVVREIRSKMGDVAKTHSYTWGSHASRLVDALRKGHYDVALSRGEFVRLVTWVDANAPYYGSFYGRRNLRYKGHKNFRPILNYRQAVSTEAPLPDEQR